MAKFIDILSGYEGFEVIKQDTICLFSFDNTSYYAYFKCISHEGNPYPLEHQRSQLPKLQEFNEVKNSSVPFLFLGYDIDNDVFVCWEPGKVKPRLNNKKYVSFYSRLSAQEGVEVGKIKEEILTNGDKFVLFKRTDAISFLQMIDVHFSELKEGSKHIKSIDNSSSESLKGTDLQGRLSNISENESIRLLIDNYPEETPTLTIIGECMNRFGSLYHKMQFSDWGKLIRAYLYNKKTHL